MTVKVVYGVANTTAPGGAHVGFGGPYVRNRSPVPGAPGVDPSQHILVTLLDAHANLDDSTIRITVAINERAAVAAWVGSLGGAQAGFSSSTVSTDNTPPEWRRMFEIVPNEPWPFNAAISVTVYASDTQPVALIPPSTWAFYVLFGATPPLGPIPFGSPVDVNSDGGEVLELALGLPDGDYYLDVQASPVARVYSARPGQGSICRSRAGVLTFVVPRVTPAENYTAVVTSLAGLWDPRPTQPLFNARRRPLFSATHALRHSLPERWLTGALRPEDEDVL